MTIPYMGKGIQEREQDIGKNYVGYFAPNGDLIGFNCLLGGSGHDSWRNPVSLAFLSFVSYKLKGTSIIKLKQNRDMKDEWRKKWLENQEYFGIDEIVLRGIRPYIRGYNSESLDFLLQCLEETYNSIRPYIGDPYDKFYLAMLEFFKNAYSNRTFFDTIGRTFCIETCENYIKRNEKWLPKIKDYSGIDRHLRDENIMYDLKISLLSYMKDICVQYLGYDSVERFYMDENGIQKCDMHDKNESKIITSSHINIIERFYNYLLMDWKIQRVPRYYFNEQTKKYEISNLESYVTDKEQRLEEEIKSIKKLVSIKDRYQYFR